MTTTERTDLPTAKELRRRVRQALDAVGARAELGEPTAPGPGLHASTPISGDVLFTLPEDSADQVDAAIAAAAQSFSSWRTTPASPWTSLPAIPIVTAL